MLLSLLRATFVICAVDRRALSSLLAFSEGIVLTIFVNGSVQMQTTPGYLHLLIMREGNV